MTTFLLVAGLVVAVVGGLAAVALVIALAAKDSEFGK